MSDHNEHILREIAHNTNEDVLANQYTARATRELLEGQHETNRLLREILQTEQASMGYLARIANALPTLTSIKIAFQGATMATPVAGPVTLTSAGQTVTASVLGFDQNGNPFTGTIPTPVFSSSDTGGAVITFDPSTGIVTAVANGTAGITASVTSAEGLALTDTETVTVAIPVVAPVLTSIKVAFA